VIHSFSPSIENSTALHSPSPRGSSVPTMSSDLVSISERSRKRKRSSSDSDSEDDQSRMKRAHCTSPLPSSNFAEPVPSSPSNLADIDQWLKSLCDEGLDLSPSVPDPVYETSPLLAPVEIDFYRYSSSSPSTSVSSLGPSTPPDYNFGKFVSTT